MDPARYRRIRALLHEAESLEPARRRAFVTRAAEGDAELVADVMGLLEDDVVATRDVVPDAVPLAAASPDLAAGTALGPWTLGAEIGRGGMGVVYEATGAGAQGVVAVKVILPGLLALPAMRERFAREARLGLAIDHENVVRTLAFGDVRLRDTTLHYLVMERVRGRTLRRLLDEMGAVPEALVREIALQAARGLEALHAAGVVHRDLKPENLLLSDDRRVRIMDLGVAKVAASGPALTHEGQFVGSMRYASPEQCAGAEVGPASDQYGLGAVLYELVAGRPPFDESDPVAMLRAQVEATPVPLVDRAPACSDFFGAVVARLLEKRPDRRFASAGALARVLEEAETGAWWGEARRDARRGRGARVESAAALPLVGRGRERDALLEAWRAARRSEGTIVLLHGEGGIGKTRLVEDLLRSLGEEHAEVLRTGFPPAGVPGRLEDAIASRLGDGAIEAELARRLGVAPSVADAFAAHLRRRPPAAGVDAIRPQELEGLVARFVRSLAADAPVVWVVEDLHYASADARRAVVSLGRAIASRRVLLLVTARPSLDPATIAALSSSPSYRRVDVERLEEEGVRALASEVLGDGALGRLVAPRLARRADGVPFYVLALLHEVKRSGRLGRDAAGTMRDVGVLDDLEAPRALTDLLRARLASLPAGDRRVLDAASVEGHEFDPARVAIAIDRPRLEVLECLGRLERVEGLVRSGPRLSRFDHHLLQEVAYAELVPALRAELHARFADVIERGTGAGGALPSEARVRVVWHRLRGPDPALAAAAAVEAADICQAAARYEEARDLIGRALAAYVGREDRLRVTLLLRLAWLLSTLGRGEEATPCLDEAERVTRTLPGAPGLPRVRLQRAAYAIERGRFDEALAQASEAIGEMRAAGDAIGTFDAMEARGLALWSLGRHAEALVAHRESLAFAETLASPLPVARAASSLANVLQELGHHADAELHQRAALEGLEAAGDRLNVETVRVNLGNVLWGVGRYAEATACYERAIVVTRERALRGTEAQAWVNLGEVRLRLGDLAGAREAFRLCEELSAEGGRPRTGAYAIHGLGVVAHWSGDRVEARRRLDEALRVRRRIQARPGIAETCLALGVLDAEEGATGVAAERLAEARRLADEVGDPSASVLARLHAAFLPGGDPSGARRAFDEVERRLAAGARTEARWLLWRHFGDPADLAAARALLDEQANRSPAAARAAMFEHVPYARAILEACARRP